MQTSPITRLLDNNHDIIDYYYQGIVTERYRDGGCWELYLDDHARMCIVTEPYLRYGPSRYDPRHIELCSYWWDGSVARYNGAVWYSVGREEFLHDLSTTLWTIVHGLGQHGEMPEEADEHWGRW